MAFFRRLFSFMNNNKPTTEIETQNEISIATYYLGHTFAAKPNSDELRRAAHILTSKTKKDLEKNQVPLVHLCFDSATVLLKDGRNHKCREYDVRKIVMSCIDAKNQRLVAIFYHNDSPFIGNPMKSNMLECHLCLCKTKESAKTAANKIGELLSKEYKIPSRHPIKNLEDGSVRLSKANYDDFDYENVSKFFQQKVFGMEPLEGGGSGLSTPFSSVSTFATTTGFDSGCASTIASVDIRPDEISNGIRESTIEEHEEIDQTTSSSTENLNTTENDNTVYHNRYSVHYDLEEEKRDAGADDDIERQPLTSVGQFHNDDDPVGLKTPELQRLLDLGETNI